MADKRKPAEKHVVVDGSNIATEGRTMPSLQQLDEAVQAFIAEHPHDRVTVVVDATFGHRIDASEKDTFEEAVLAGELVSPPAGAIGRGDAFVLQIADKANATILSNDSFQEFHGQYDWLFDEGRLIGGKPVTGVGWIFMLRTPVRGPASRRAVRGAQKRAARPVATSKKAATSAPATKASEAGPGRRGRRKKAEPAAPAAPARAPAAEQPAKESGRRRRRGTSSAKHMEPINEPLAFIEFIAEHPLGSTVLGTVDSFSSHGAYVLVNGARCYVPLKAMAEPAPTRARDVLSIGEERDFVVVALDPPRRGIDLALPGFAVIQEPTEPIDALEGDAQAEPSTAEQAQEGIMSTAEATAGEGDVPEPAPAKARKARTAATRPSGATTEAGTELAAEEVPQVAQAKKATTRKSAAKKSTKKAAAAKSTARKTTAAKKKSTAKKAPARKTAAKRTTAKKSAAKRPAARKSTAKKTAKKSTAKKSTARKSTAKKSTAKKSTARKSTAKKSTAKKSTARKSAARKR